MKKMNNAQKFFREKWIIELNNLISDLIKNPSSNDIYQEKKIMTMKAFKTFINFIINNECYDYISLYYIADLLKRLANQLPLYEINDTPEEWSPITDISDPEKITYQAVRCSSLFKTVNIRTGEISYQDINRFEGTYKNRRYVHYHSGLIDRVLSEYYPITMPYYPGSDNIIVTTEDFLVNPINGDFDTIGILYAEHPYLGIRKINRFFKENSKKTIGWVKITYFEYILRKLLKMDPNSKLAHKIRKLHYKKKKEFYGDPIKFTIDECRNSDIENTEKVFEDMENASESGTANNTEQTHRD